MAPRHHLLGATLGAGLAWILLFVVSLGGECRVEISASGAAEATVAGRLVTPDGAVIDLEGEHTPLRLSVPRGTEGRVWTPSGGEIQVAISFGRPLIRYEGTVRGAHVTFRSSSSGIQVGTE